MEVTVVKLKIVYRLYQGCSQAAGAVPLPHHYSEQIFPKKGKFFGKKIGIFRGKMRFCPLKIDLEFFFTLPPSRIIPCYILVLYHMAISISYLGSYIWVGKLLHTIKLQLFFCGQKKTLNVWTRLSEFRILKTGFPTLKIPVADRNQHNFNYEYIHLTNTQTQVLVNKIGKRNIIFWGIDTDADRIVYKVQYIRQVRG